MTKLTVAELGPEMPGLVKRAADGTERIIIEHGGKGVAAIVSMDALALIEKLEDQIDLEQARIALQEHGDDISWEELKAEAGLK